MTEILVNGIVSNSIEFFDAFSDGYKEKYLKDNEEGREMLDKFIKLMKKEKNLDSFRQHVASYVKETSICIESTRKSKSKSKSKRNNNIKKNKSSLFQKTSI